MCGLLQNMNVKETTVIVLYICSYEMEGLARFPSIDTQL